MKFILSIFLVFSLVVKSQSYNYYFGNLHSHTGFSDGNKDSVTTGVTKPDGSYSYAKQSQNFDFLGISEHNHYSSLRNPGFKLPRYQEGLNMADAANQEGIFLALFGMEYGISSGNNGHVIVYGFNQLIGWESNISGQPGNNYDIFNAKNDYDGLFKKIKNNPNAFAYLAHPYWTDFTRDGNDSTAIAFASYNAMYDSAIVGVPLRSGNAFSVFDDYSDYSMGDYFNYYKKMLYLGYHLGIGYDHDNHYTNFGRSNGGRLVIVAPSLTRANLTTAMRNMNFYGSDDSNAKVEFTMNGNIMGSIVSGNYFPSFNIIHNDPDGEQADTIRIWRGYKNSGGLWAQIMNTTVSGNTMQFTDQSIQPNIEYFYFAEIRQTDRQWIVTSPIWYKASTALSVKNSTTQTKAVVFPNPVKHELSISVEQNIGSQILIQDLTGRIVYQTVLKEKNLVVNTSVFQKGLYTLTIKSDGGILTEKIVIE